MFKGILNSKLASLAIFILFLGFGLLNINQAPIQFWDESTNLGVILESASRDEWWNLSYGGVEFWEKPPLYYWLGIAVSKFVGAGDLFVALRGLSVLAGLGTAILVWRFCLDKWGRTAANFSALVWLALPHLWLFNPGGTFATHNLRSADSDALQVLFMVGALLCVEKFLEGMGRRGRVGYIVLASILSGIAYMLKGPFALLPLIYLGLSLGWRWRKGRHSRRGVIRLITISVAALMPFLLVVVPWHVYMHIQFGWDFWREYLVYHQLARAGTTLEGHSRSPLFYFSYLLDLRSSGILLIVILAAVRVRFDIRAHKILLLALVLLVMLSFLGTKIAWYSLYVIPILVIASAGLFVAVKQTRAKHRIFTFLLFTLISVQILVTLLNLGLHLERFTDNYAEGIEQLYTPEGELNRQIYYEYLTAR